MKVNIQLWVALLMLCLIAFKPMVCFAQDGRDSLSTLPSSQDDIMDLLLKDEKDKKPQFISNAFKSSRVIQGHSMEMIGEGVLDFRLLHRFGMIKDGWRNMFGLDQASMRLGFDYGLSKNLTIGIGRTNYLKEWDAFVKWRLVHQRKNYQAIPFSVLWISGMTLNTTPFASGRINYFTSKLGFYHQCIIGRKFSKHFTLQVSPTLVHLNLVELKSDKNDMFALGVGSRIRLTNRTSLVLDTHPILYGARSNYHQWPLSIGLDIETGGHVFQLHVSNARGMNERAFIAETFQTWSKGEIQFGFNMSRVFTIKKNTSESF
ncbi:MAG TPA: DUF5777 family beta-barrel protein [Chitinophagaceae bacterium]|nr:DUF5777 family beta-barrel protein [Chitinophagaceae bacterium]